MPASFHLGENWGCSSLGESFSALVISGLFIHNFVASFIGALNFKEDEYYIGEIVSSYKANNHLTTQLICFGISISKK